MVQIVSTETGYFVEHTDTFPTADIVSLKRMHTRRDASLLHGIREWEPRQDGSIKVTCVDGFGPLSITTQLTLREVEDKIFFNSEGPSPLTLDGTWEFCKTGPNATKVTLRQNIATHGVSKYLPLRRLLTSRISSVFREMHSHL